MVKQIPTSTPTAFCSCHGTTVLWETQPQLIYAGIRWYEIWMVLWQRHWMHSNIILIIADSSSVTQCMLCYISTSIFLERELFNCIQFHIKGKSTTIKRTEFQKGQHHLKYMLSDSFRLSWWVHEWNNYHPPSVQLIHLAIACNYKFHY